MSLSTPALIELKHLQEDTLKGMSSEEICNSLYTLAKAILELNDDLPDRKIAAEKDVGFDIRRKTVSPQDRVYYLTQHELDFAAYLADILE